MDGLICIRNKFTAYGSSVRIESKNGLKIADLARADVFDYIEAFSIGPDATTIWVA